jgi:integrase
MQDEMKTQPAPVAIPCTLAPCDEPSRALSALPKGVERHGNSLRISFRYAGERCREIVERDQNDTLSIAIAGRIRQQVVDSIAAGSFDYLKRFPDSATARRLSQSKVEQDGELSRPSRRDLNQMTVAEGVEAWLMTQRSGKSKSTAVNYTSRAQHVLNKFGTRLLAEVTTQELQQFRNTLVLSRHNQTGVSPKTANDVLTVVRGVWKDAKNNGITSASRAEGLTNHELKEDSSADPFELDEMQRLLWADPTNQASARMVVSNCWVGLSRSELIALAIEDVDLERRKLTVRRAFVHGEHKAPKEKSRTREIDLVEPAIELLREILADIGDVQPEEIEVTGLDNLTVKNESVRLLFRNPNTAQPWSASALDRWFKSHCEIAGVRHRGVNQCRHTFASRALSRYLPKEWVIHQLGHGDFQMLKKHYAKWMPSETDKAPVLIGEINAAMNVGWSVLPPQAIQEENTYPLAKSA